MRGAWHLIRTRREKRQPEWLLIKSQDRYAGAGEADDLVGAAVAPKSGARKLRARASRKTVVGSKSSKSTLRRIVDKAASLAGAKKMRLAAGAFAPQLARSAESPPDGDAWLHEVKWDGYRLLASIVGGQPTLWSRNALDWTARLPDIVKALTGLGLDTARFDGELIAMVGGRSDFNALQAVLAGEGRAPLVYVLFDLLHLQDWSLVHCDLIERKEILRAIVNLRETKSLMFSEHHVGEGRTVFEQAIAHGLEGIMCKRAASPYHAGRSDDWRKVKRALSDEFAVVGYTLPKGSRSGIGSLLLAAGEKNGGWRYAGRVGSGFSQAQLDSLRRELGRSERRQPAVRETSIDPLLRGAHWVKPDMVAEVYYRGIGNLGLLRQPSLKTLRIDKTAADLLREAVGKRRREAGMRTDKTTSSRHASKPEIKKSGPRVKKAASLTASGTMTLSHPERVVFPGDGFTKRDVADYYTAVMPRFLAGVIGRPLSIVRCPQGIAKACFFQKHLTPGLKHVRSVRLKEESGASGKYLFVDSAEGVLELVQFNALEFHPWAATAKDSDHADYVVFDLDPAPDVPWRRVVAAATHVRELLAASGLTSFVRTTGGKGLHVVLPLRPAVAWAQVKNFAHAFAASVATAQPDEFVAVASKSRRGGKIYVDYLRNARGATSVASYSLRSRPGAPVAVPLRWNELRDLDSAAALNLRSVPARLKRLRSDPWAGFDSIRQGLSAIGENAAESRRPRKRA